MHPLLIDKPNKASPLFGLEQNALKTRLQQLIDTLAMDDSLLLLRLIEFPERCEDGALPESAL